MQNIHENKTYKWFPPSIFIYTNIFLEVWEITKHKYRTKGYSHTEFYVDRIVQVNESFESTFNQTKTTQIKGVLIQRFVCAHIKYVEIDPY